MFGGFTLTCCLWSTWSITMQLDLFAWVWRLLVSANVKYLYVYILFFMCMWQLKREITAKISDAIVLRPVVLLPGRAFSKNHLSAFLVCFSSSLGVVHLSWTKIMYARNSIKRLIIIRLIKRNTCAYVKVTSVVVRWQQKR